MRKRVLAGVMTLAMAASLFACGDKKEETTTAATTAAAETTVAAETTEAAEKTEAAADTTEAADTEEKETEAASEEAAEAASKEAVLPEKLTYDGQFEVEIIGYEYFDTKEDMDYDILNVYYEMTALDDSLKTTRRIYWSATQDGEELKSNPLNQKPYYDPVYKNVSRLQPINGVKLRDVSTFAVNKGSKSVISIGVGKKDGEYDLNFDVDPTWEMADMRSEHYRLAKVDKPSFGPGNMPEGSYEDRYDIKINGITDYSKVMELNSDFGSEYYTCVGVSYTITSHYSKEQSPFMLFSTELRVLQDGATLLDTSPGQESADYGKTQSDLPLYQKIQPGESIDFVQYYELRSDSPIEICFQSFTGDIFADMVYDVEPITDNN